MSNESAGSASFLSSLSTLTMADISSTSPSTVPPSAPPSSPSATFTTNGSSVLSPATSYVYTSALLSSSVSVISDSPPQSTSSFSLDATTTAASSDASTQLSSFASQASSPQTSAFSTQTNTTNQSPQSPSAAPVSLVTNANTSGSPLTSIGASTQQGGSLATHTSIGTTSSSNLFVNNRGAVIGTSVAVAIVCTAILACLCVARRRWLRRRARGRMLDITMPGDDANRGLRQGSHDYPAMSMTNDGSDSFASTYRGDTLHHGIGSGRMFTANTSAPATNNATNGAGWQRDGPFDDHFAIDHTSGGLTERVVVANSRIHSPVPSLAPSTPSLYPPSLPPVETENNAISMAHPMSLSTSFNSNPPPRPPRLVRPPPAPSKVLIESTTPAPFVTVIPPSTSRYTLSGLSSFAPAENARSKLSKLLELDLPTPPSSISSHSHTDSPRCNTASTLVLNRPTNVHPEGTNSLF